MCESMWQIPDTVDLRVSSIPAPNIDNADEVKKLFGIALGQGKDPFSAALDATNNNTNIALYVSQRWLLDPIVVASRDLYSKTVHNSDELLDADQLASKLLEMAEERNASNSFYMLEGRDRLKCLELYAKIRGYDKSAAPSISNTVNNMVVKFVAPEKKDNSQQIDNQQLSNELNNKSPLKLKLVSSSA